MNDFRCEAMRPLNEDVPRHTHHKGAAQVIDHHEGQMPPHSVAEQSTKQARTKLRKTDSEDQLVPYPHV